MGKWVEFASGLRVGEDKIAFGHIKFIIKDEGVILDIGDKQYNLSELNGKFNDDMRRAIIELSPMYYRYTQNI